VLPQISHAFPSRNASLSEAVSPKSRFLLALRLLATVLQVGRMCPLDCFL